MPLQGSKCHRLLAIDPTFFVETPEDGYLALGALLNGCSKELVECAKARQARKIRLAQAEKVNLPLMTEAIEGGHDGLLFE